MAFALIYIYFSCCCGFCMWTLVFLHKDEAGHIRFCYVTNAKKKRPASS